MYVVYFGFYLLFLLFIWAFFGVAWIHAHKFKNFSHHIVFATRALLAFLVLLSVSGAILLYNIVNTSNIFSIDTQSTQIENQNYY